MINWVELLAKNSAILFNGRLIKVIRRWNKPNIFLYPK